jgi:hypothetical protein
MISIFQITNPDQGTHDEEQADLADSRILDAPTLSVNIDCPSVGDKPVEGVCVLRHRPHSQDTMWKTVKALNVLQGPRIEPFSEDR